MSVLLQLHEISRVVGDAVLAADITPQAPPGADKINILLAWVKWLFTAAAVAGGMFIGVKMVLAHRRGDDTNVASLGYWLGGCVLAGAAPHLVTALL
jgi:hypothetical protein